MCHSPSTSANGCSGTRRRMKNMRVERGDDFLFLEGWKESIMPCTPHALPWQFNSLVTTTTAPTQIREGLYHWPHMEEYIFKLVTMIALVIVLLLCRLAKSLHLGIKVCLSQQQKSISAPPNIQERKAHVHTPSTNETKLKNGTQSCVSAR
jgi:hypothetical protein